MADLSQESVGAFIRYLTILHKSSKSFKSTVRLIRKDCKCFRPKSGEAAKRLLPEILGDLLGKFFIPDQSEYRERMARYIYFGNIQDKWDVQDAFDQDLRLPITAPSIVVKINARVSIREWEAIWTSMINPKMNKLKTKVDSSSIKPVPNIDLLLEIYARLKAGKTVHMISRDMVDLKQSIGNESKTTYDYDLIRKMKKDIFALIEPL